MKSLLIGALLFIGCSEACEDGWHDHTPFCYKHFNQEVSFWDADWNCKMEGASLASVHSADENTYLLNYGSNQWIGLTTMMPFSQWTDGTWVEYTNYAPNQPDNDEHRCVKMGWDDNRSKWDDTDCSARLPYTCKKWNDGDFEIPCDYGWEQFGGHCYRSARESFNFATVSCQLDGGNVASIHSEEENEFVATLNFGNGGYIIGLNDIDEEGVYVWPDGSEIDYENWLPGSPFPDYWGTRDCVEVFGEFQDYGWHQTDCSFEGLVVCKKVAGGLNSC